MQRSLGEVKRQDVLRQLARFAFGRANDCVKLVLEDTPDVDALDLSLLSEVKRNEKGTVEIKLVDRIRALERLLEAILSCVTLRFCSIMQRLVFRQAIRCV